MQRVRQLLPTGGQTMTQPTIKIVCDTCGKPAPLMDDNGKWAGVPPSEREPYEEEKWLRR